VVVRRGEKQKFEGREDMQMEEVSKWKEEEKDTTLTSLPKPRPPGEKKRRITEIQKLEINGGEHKIPWTEKGTAIEQRRTEKGSLDKREQRRTEKGSSTIEQRKTRGHAAKQTQSSNHDVVAKYRKEEKVGAHQEKNTSKVRHPEVVHV
jgi:hypothetical protein